MIEQVYKHGEKHEDWIERPWVDWSHEATSFSNALLR